MKPYIFAYNLISIDGRISWFKDNYNLISDYYTLSYNWKIDAILTGSNTIFELGQNEEEQDALPLPKPEINPVPEEIKPLIFEPKPLLIVVDSTGKIHNWRLMQQQPWYRDILVLCSENTPKSYLDYLKIRNLDYLIVGKEKVDILKALSILKNEQNINHIRTDCGGKLIGHLLTTKLLDEIKLLIAPNLAGGSPFPNIIENFLAPLDKVLDLQLLNSEIIKEKFVLLSYKVKY